MLPQLFPARGNRRSSLPHSVFGFRQDIGNQHQLAAPCDRALTDGVELTHTLDTVAKKFDADRERLGKWEHINNSTAHGKIASRFNELFAIEMMRFQPMDKRCKARFTSYGNQSMILQQNPF